MIPTDYGARCDRHIHEVVFLPRCQHCQLLNLEYRLFGVTKEPTNAEA